MKPDITVRFEHAGLKTGRGALAWHARRLLTRVLKDLKLPGASMTVLFCSEERIQELNRQFRELDAPTDVLSFPALEDAKGLAGEEAPYLGDLAICLAYTARQAAAAGRNLDDEVSLLLVHGTLHLLGWDHDTKAREARMWREQDRLLALADGLPGPAIEWRA